MNNQSQKTTNQEKLPMRKNSIDLDMITIPSGKFMMGSSSDEKDVMWDEYPQHEVELTYSYEMSSTEITNLQYELFDPSHKKLRGNRKEVGFSSGDNEAVVNVSHKDAMNFCEWLSKKENKPYRLPTEAEWEYACRAGTTTKYYTGNELPKSLQKDQRLVKKWDAKKFYKKHDLVVGQGEPNLWGLYDMHGNVENWCLDRFGYYTEEKEINPLYQNNNIPDGSAFVTRGGSFGVKLEHLRSSRRLGAMENDKNWIIGFRVVCADLPSEESIINTRVPLISRCMKNISQVEYPDYQTKVSGEKNKQNPIYMDPVPYLIDPAEEDRALLRPHNHCPAVTWCSNGDILTVWFSTFGEHDRDMVILGTRLQKDAKEYEPASLFFRIPGRNTTGTALLTNKDGTIFHVNGMEVATSWKTLAMVMRKSKDNGATWSEPRFISPKHQFRNQVIPCLFRTKSGDLIQLCDATPFGSGGSAFWISKDNGKTWKDMGTDQNNKTKRKPRFANKRKGNWIAGIHASAVELDDSKFMAFGRANYIKMKTPTSISSDGGKTWQYSASPFPGITYGQRLVLRRLNEGPLLCVTFTDSIRIPGEKKYSFMKGMEMKALDGVTKKCYGMFATISYDNGKTWPIKRFLDFTGSKGARKEVGFGFKEGIIIDDTHGELKGYLAGTQSPDGMIHIVSSTSHYRFNLSWLEE